MVVFTNRELFIRKMLIDKYSNEDELNDIVKKISNIGESIGFVGINPPKNTTKDYKRRHKYDVWIAKEVKKDLNLLNNIEGFVFILDWAIEKKINIFNYNFNQAYKEQDEWHRMISQNYEIEPLPILNIENERVLYRCSDGEYFIYLLSYLDLNYEGKLMKNCVGGSHYKNRSKKGMSTYISLRDGKNEPHITVEINNNSKKIIQIKGKTNKPPQEKYLQKFLEFVLFYTNYKNLEKKRKDKIFKPIFINKKI
jgi:hypothetical protein